MRYFKALLILYVFSNSIIFSKDVTPNNRVSNSLIVRDAPNTNGAIIGRLLPGEHKPFSKSVPYYYEIEFSDAIKGYVHKGYANVINSTSDKKLLSLHFIDVGQGDSTLITCPNGKNILVDAGSTGGGSAEDAREYLESALSGRTQRIHTLVITHPDGDHYNYLEDVLNDIPIDQVIWTGVKFDFASSDFRDWLFDASFEGKRINLDSTYFDKPNEPNSEIDCGEAKIYVLAAGIEASKSRKNALSIVLMVDYGDFETILTGDATFDTEKAILARYDPNWLDIDLLKLGHHGSSTTSTSPTWADILKPEYSVVSAGFNSAHGHPRKSVVDTVEPFATDTLVLHDVNLSTGKRGSYDWSNSKIDYKKNIYSTVNSGTIVVQFDGVEISVRLEK